jgi:hypothetical protein
MVLGNGKSNDFWFDVVLKCFPWRTSSQEFLMIKFVQYKYMGRTGICHLKDSLMKTSRSNLEDYILSCSDVLWTMKDQAKWTKGRFSMKYVCRHLCRPGWYELQSHLENQDTSQDKKKFMWLAMQDAVTVSLARKQSLCLTHWKRNHKPSLLWLCLGTFCLEPKSPTSRDFLV